MTEKEPFYPFVLDHKPRIFLNWVLYKLFKRVKFNENMGEKLKLMHRDGTVVYAIKYRGSLDYLMCHYRFRKSRLPYPKMAFDLNMSLVLPLGELFNVLKFYTSSLLRRRRLPDPYDTGFYEKAIEEGTCALVCLVDPKGFVRRYIHAEKDPLQLLLETQKKMDKPIFMVPQLVLYKKTPEKEHPGLLDIFFGYKDKPGIPRKIILFFRHNRRAFIDFGEPVNLADFLDGRPRDESLSDQAVELRQILLEGIDRQKRVILGPVIKSREQFKERVLNDPDVIQTIQKRSSKNNIPVKQVRKEAARYFDEIAADYNITYIQFGNVVLNWLWKKIFHGIDVRPGELAAVRDCSRKGPVVYVPSHKSHIDYLVLNYVLYRHHMHVPRIAAGNNLNFWPVGPFFRKAGAFFIRRTFKGATLYAAVFVRYMKALLEERHPLEFFIEGGRSRSGKLVLPKIGFLSILVQAFREGYCDDLVFVPASITYDRVLEERAYLKELKGEAKEKENIRQVVRTRRFLKKKYGKVYIRFGRPILLREYLEQQGESTGGSQKHLAFDLIRSINRVSLVTPMALLSTAILTRHRRGFTFPELSRTADTLLSFLERYDFPTATSLKQRDQALWKSMEALIKGNVVNTLEDTEGTETFYYVDAEKMRELEYYKNSIIHCFLSHAFVALSLLTGKDEVKTGQGILDDYDFLKGLFRYEFIYEEEKTSREEIDEATACFMDLSYITGDNGGAGFRLTRLGFDRLPIWAALVKTFLESYWIATRSMISKGLEGKRKNAELLKNMNYLGLRYHKLGLVEHLESVSQLNFKNAIRVIRKDVLSGAKRSEEERARAAERLSRFSQRLYDLSAYRK